MSLAEIRVLMGLNPRFPSVLEASLSAFESLLAEGDDDPTHDASARAAHLSKVAMVSKKAGHHLDAHAQHEIAKGEIQKNLKGLAKDHPNRTSLQTRHDHHHKIAQLHLKHADKDKSQTG